MNERSRKLARMAVASVFIAAGCVTVAGRLSAQTTPPASAGDAVVPPAIWTGATAYDASRGKLVLFGGYFRGTYFGDTWEWNGAKWERTAQSGPAGRNSPALAYDSERRQIVMFGGDRGPEGALSDTWILDAGGWRLVATSGPTPRSIHAMVYDERRKRVVLFGGTANGRTLGDTWEWDGVQWQMASAAGPPPRALHGMAYDSARARTVLFGGQTVLAADSPSLRDTWEWDGARWTSIAADVAPGPRDHIALGYDARARAVVLHGTTAGTDARAETWTFDGTRWMLASSTGPRRGGARFAWNPDDRTLLLYGGGDGAPTNELWSWNGAEWARLR